MGLGDILTSAASGIGGILSHIGGNRHGREQHEQGRGSWERRAAAQAARSQFINGIMRGFGVEGVIDPAQMQRLTTPVAFPRYVGRNWMEGLGSFLSGAAPYLGGSGQHGASGAGGSGAYPSFSGDLPEGSDPGFNYGTGRRPPSTSTDNPQDIYDLFENL